jgi:hypothetical protein
MHNVPSDETVLSHTQAWLEKAVIGLNLCPFAKAVQVKQQIRYRVSAAQTPEQLAQDLQQELTLLDHSNPAEIDTTLLIHPHVLSDFLDYNDFLDVGDALLEQLGLSGTVQIASFHPQYQFAGTAPDDIDNFTNRSPYPILHLLRESSIESALSSFSDPDAIFARNIAKLREIGREGWQALDLPISSQSQ